jgi:hypothetical protein
MTRPFNKRFVAFCRYYWPDKSPEQVLSLANFGVGFNLWIRDIKAAFFAERYPELSFNDWDLRIPPAGSFDAFIEEVVSSRTTIPRHVPVMDGSGLKWERRT